MSYINKDGIPVGLPYCYIPDDKKNKNNDCSTYYIIECRYYKHIGDLVGRCTKLDVEIIDQVKECGIE